MEPQVVNPARRLGGDVRQATEPAAGPTGLEMLEDVLGLIGGLVVALLPALILAVPGIALLALVVIPLAIVAIPVVIAGAILAIPFRLVRSLRRRSR
jgi:hypothetical protein